MFSLPVAGRNNCRPPSSISFVCSYPLTTTSIPNITLQTANGRITVFLPATKTAAQCSAETPPADNAAARAAGRIKHPVWNAQTGGSEKTGIGKNKRRERQL